MKEEEEAAPSGGTDADGPTPMDTQLSGLDERSAYLHYLSSTCSLPPLLLALLLTVTLKLTLTFIMLKLKLMVTEYNQHSYSTLFHNKCNGCVGTISDTAYA